MTNLENLLKNLTGKNEHEAQTAACYLINNADLELFKLLVNKTDFLFDFVRNNVNKRIEKAVHKNNFMNLLKFFEVYSPYYDDLFASILAKHANQDLTDDIFELLEKGTNAQKSYAAKYFAYIPDTVALEPLSKYAFCDDEFLSANSAEALGQMQDDVSYDIALELLESHDDFECLGAVKFFTYYSRNYPLDKIIDTMLKSKMPENIAGQIPYAVSLTDLLENSFNENILFIIDYIISGLGEILPLSDIFQFELYDVIESLIIKNRTNNPLSGKIAQILLSAFSKFRLFNENAEYVFDESNETKNEVNSIYSLLKKQPAEFWNSQKEMLLNELSENEMRVLSAISVVNEFHLKKAVPLIKKLLDSENEIIIYEAIN
ncbi:MAG: HEAT repeat domain-containing protein, partial [Candidatus Gastranaerophilales bacterium]|nr:HEAT repeat domain-containing protein [Candidatus Gastranaerophilales bacterium]